jgi:hypothetical protein
MTMLILDEIGGAKRMRCLNEPAFYLDVTCEAFGVEIDALLRYNLGSFRPPSDGGSIICLFVEHNTCICNMKTSMVQRGALRMRGYSVYSAVLTGYA